MNIDSCPGLEAAITASPLVSAVLKRWEEVELPDGWLVAGAVVQTYWNHAFGYPPDYGIDDVDLVYFDAADLSEESEVAHTRRVESLFAGLDVRLDVKNEARVHLWYERKFGIEIAPYDDVASAIETFPTTVGSIGIRPNDQSIELFAPFGLEDLENLIVRPNKTLVSRAVYEAKVSRWRQHWPDVRYLPW